MSDAKSTQDWQKDWQALQQQYWNAWQDATRGLNPAPGSNTPWHEGLEQWSRLFASSGKQSETAERLMDSAKAYVGLMQSMLAASAGKDAGAGVREAWGKALRDGLQMPGMDTALSGNPLAAMMKTMQGSVAHGIGDLPAAFAPFMTQAREEGMSWLKAPAFGYAREHQERMQKAAVAFAQFNEALGKYNALMLKASQRGFEVFEDKLAQRAEPGRQVDSLRALYDLWVDAAEEAYAEVALSDEFRSVYGELVNAQMRVRANVQAEVERVGAELGMPTRSELDSVHKRLHELRRNLRSPAAGVDANLEGRIKALQDEVRALRDASRNRAPATAPAAAKRDAAVRAKPARKSVAATAKPRKASRSDVNKFDAALRAMKDKSGRRA